MNLWQITSFTLMTALGATVLMLPAGLLLAWILARRNPCFRERAFGGALARHGLQAGASAPRSFHG